MLNEMEKKMAKITTTIAANGWSKEHLQHLLATNDRAVERALIQIYNRQTRSEQVSMHTSEHNSVGFTAFDGEFLSNVAEKCIKFHGLTPGQLVAVRPKMMKYWKQLLEIAAESTKSPTFPRPAPQPVKARSAKKQMSMYS